MSVLRDSLVIFTDRDLGTRFPAILAEAGLTVNRHSDLFPPDCPDEVWLEDVGKKGWIAVTHDSRIRYKPNELAAVIRHRVRLLVVVGKAPFPELAKNFALTKGGLANSFHSTERRGLRRSIDHLQKNSLATPTRQEAFRFGTRRRKPNRILVRLRYWLRRLGSLWN